MGSSAQSETNESGLDSNVGAGTIDIAALKPWNHLELSDNKVEAEDIPVKCACNKFGKIIETLADFESMLNLEKDEKKESEDEDEDKEKTTGIGKTIGSVAGAAVGTYFGGPVGGMVGSMAGGYAGDYVESAITGKETQNKLDLDSENGTTGIGSSVGGIAGEAVGSYFGGSIGGTVGSYVGEEVGDRAEQYLTEKYNDKDYKDEDKHYNQGNDYTSLANMSSILSQ